MTGSTWRKWDLHFHTPSSYDYQDKKITNQEIIDNLIANTIEVVAITDHHVIDVDRVKELQKLGAGKVTVLPGIEFRAELGGSESIHFIGIFSERCDLDDIWIKLQGGCKISSADLVKAGGDKNIHCDLKDTCKLIHELGGLVTVHAGDKTNTIENITNSLPYKMALKTDLVINHIDILELGKEEDQKDYDEKVFPAINYRLPMIICSDNHNVKKYSVKQNLWIKADPTFEGLRQIIFEPMYRVHIGELPPYTPPIRINKVILDFPSDSTFEGGIFCLAGRKEIEFSPNFNCLIGGRGTGKSTILNLIHEKLKPGTNRFFKNKKIKDSMNKPILIEEKVAIDGDSDEKFIEFLSQNEIEEFAQDNAKLTDAIYIRILKKNEDGLIVKYEASLKEKLESFKLYIIHLKKVRSLKLEVEQKEKELETNKKIVDSFTSPEYLALSADLKAISAEANSIVDSDDKYRALTKELSGLNETYQQDSPSNLYAIEIAKIVSGVEKLLTDTKTTDFTPAQKRVGELAAAQKTKKEELRQFLVGKGLTEENLQDIAAANIIISNLEGEIAKKNVEIEQTQKKIEAFDKVQVEAESNQYKGELEKQIGSISTFLETLDNKMVKPISLHLEFDLEEACNKIFLDFKSIFEGAMAKNPHKYKGENNLKEILFCVQPSEVSSKTQEQFLEEIQKHYSTSGAKNFLLDLFADNVNFEIYKLACERNLLDYSDFKKIKVEYDKRPIESSSFGQRCTAALVILLLLGNNPIIIDEPEAHLDSLLISNYLVEVIKNRKQGRQIIFATHNANFVVNGDAELIYILDTENASTTTTLTATTIENESTRGTLISLEGGKEAFLQREDKYQIQ